MPESHLWLVNHLGGVFTLGTCHRKFRQLENTLDDVVNIKRLSASHWCAWAIGHDHRVYIYVRSSDVPIRVPETTFENQRWSPVHGFSNKSLIPTDRDAWSNEAGTVYRPKESVRLPSAHWEWEGDWLIDDNLRGEVMGIEGWQYAFDFPAVYTPEKHWNSFVRKRKWIRFRRFSSTDVWARISDMEVVERTECFIDLSVGGFLMPSQPAGFLAVWAVTNNGHVYVRTDVNHDNPEGSTWHELETTDQIGIINISVGASNLIWAVTWDGNMLVRSQVTRNNIYGTGWIVVEHPDNATRFMQVSVGNNSVWAVSREGKVWFRKGTSGYDMFWKHESAVGTNWVEMVGEMAQVAVSSNDQVFAIDLTGKNIYFRTGVTSVDLTGKTWQAVSLHEDLTFLEKEGLLSEGDVCSCGDPAAACALHGEARPRLNSATTSSSSISTLTNVEESCDGFNSPVLPYQPFPIHISEPFSILDLASTPWKQSQCTTEDSSNDDVFQHSPQTNTTSPSLTDVNFSSCSCLLAAAADCNSTVFEEREKPPVTIAPLQKSHSFHTVTPSTSQLSSLSQVSSAEVVTFFQHPAHTAVSSVAVDANHKMIECIHDSVLPAVNSIRKMPSASDSRFDHTDADEKHSPDKHHHIISSHCVKKITNPVNNNCDSNEKTDSQKHVIAHSDSVENTKVKETSLIPFSEALVDNVDLVKTDSDRALTHGIEFDHLQESNNALGKTFHFSHSVFPAVVSHDSVSDNELSSVQSESKLVTSMPDHGVSYGMSNPILNKSNGNIVESIDETVLVEKLAKEANRSPLKENLSSTSASKITIRDIESPLGHTSFQEDNKEPVIHKKKSKERRPKIVDLSYNNPNNDSIIYKTFKTKKNRRTKSASTTNANDNLGKTDTNSVGSDTSNGPVDATVLQMINEGISTPAEGQQKETDVDFTDGPVYDTDAGDQCLLESDYHSLSAAFSNRQSPSDSSLSSISGDFLTAVGFNMDSALNMLADFETALRQQVVSKTPKKEVRKTKVGERNGNSPKPVSAAGSFDSTKPGAERYIRNSPKYVSPENYRDSPKSVYPENDGDSPKSTAALNGTDGQKPLVADRDRNGPKPVVTGLDRNKSKSVFAACDIDSPLPASTPSSTNILGDQGTAQDTHSFRSCGQFCDPPSSHGALSKYSYHADKYCDTDIRSLPKHIDSEHISDEDCSVHIPFMYDTFENIPRNENEPAETKAEDVMESQYSSDNTLENCTYDAVPVSSERTPPTRENVAENQQLLKSEEIADNNFASLDSTSNSEEIFNFVTDLESDDERLDKKSEENETKSSPQCSTPEISQSQTVPESVSFLTSEFHSQVSMTSYKSTASSLPNIARGLNEDSEHYDSEDTLQVMTQRNHQSSETINIASHPKSLPFGSLAPAKKVSKYLKTPSPSIVPTDDTIPIISMTLAQPRLCWKWLNATSCVIDDPSAVEWLANTFKDSESRKKVVKIAKQLREDVLRKLQDRNKREVYRFRNMKQAVKSTTWVKKASMQMYLFGRKSRWIECKVELEQGISNLSEGSLTVHYQHKGKQKNNQILLSAMTCVKTCSDPDTLSGFVVYTPETNIIHQPLFLKASSENEAAEWIGCLGTANASIWSINCSVAPGAIWSCTFNGDVFVSPATSSPKHPSELCWGQHGGHMRLLETGPSGVTWALGFDKMPYVYNNGYGGAINGMSDMSNNTQQIVDHHRVFVYENQKWFPVIGWCCKGVFHNDFHWLTESGRSIEKKEEVKLPSTKCQWTSDWTVDFNTTGGVDPDGWQYSSNLFGPFSQHKHLRSSYRRRRWFRQYKITVLGPWQTAGSLGLVDLSVQVDPVTSTFDPVVLWAVGANGDVLCRHGVTPNNPKGQSWIHIATDLDKPFKSISVGGSYRVWGIAGDGSAWFRPGVRPHTQTGTCWLQVVPPPPGNFPLHQVSVGATSVWAVDTGANLWRRENITPTFPEGTGWELVASRVKRVSVGPRDQVWIVADASFSKMKHGAGVIYSRVGITSTRPSGTDWELVIGSGWAHVSVRGVNEAKQEDSVKKETN